MLYSAEVIQLISSRKPIYCTLLMYKRTVTAFIALSLFLHGHQDNHGNLRKSVANYIRLLAETYYIIIIKFIYYYYYIIF